MILDLRFEEKNDLQGERGHLGPGQPLCAAIAFRVSPSGRLLSLVRGLDCAIQTKKIKLFSYAARKKNPTGYQYPFYRTHVKRRHCGI